MSQEKQSSRFEELIDAARSRQTRDKIETVVDNNYRKTKSTDPNYIRTTIYLPKQLHRQLKTLATAQEQQMSDIITGLVEQWLKSQIDGE
ncbi:hypothetical protein [Calothrix sp. 336/3]|uniref:hypothetical protein n=1 Tax=Calothrix sp. 336/3 TaxID=1337936 RepID=UPI0004E35376|nr:hypothetical protein [Calothrix sp. 336/3]AKG20195.1 CopG family transcriptional regulator [Calothrix sp. 336/3]